MRCEAVLSHCTRAACRAARWFAAWKLVQGSSPSSSFYDLMSISSIETHVQPGVTLVKLTPKGVDFPSLPFPSLPFPSLPFSSLPTHAVSLCPCDMLICAVDLAGRNSRPSGGLPEVQVTGVNMAESATPAADPATNPLFTPATHAAQGPPPTPVTKVGLSPVSMPEEGPAPPFAASGACPVFGSEPAGADRRAGPPSSDEAPEAQDAGMLLSQLCV